MVNNPALTPLIFVAFHFLAVISSILIRRCGHLACREWLQRAFIGLLMSVGLLTMLGLGDGNSSWLFSAATFATMAVGATFDIGQTNAASF